jgi:hypothetical protein
MKNLTNKLITICVVSIFVFCLFGKSTQTSIIKKIENLLSIDYSTLKYASGSGGGGDEWINFDKKRYNAHSEETISYFKEIALGREYGETQTQLYRWDVNLKIYIYGQNTPYLNQELNDIVYELNDIINTIDIEVVNNPSSANVFIYLGSYLDYKKERPNQNLTLLEESWGLFTVSANKSYMYIDVTRANEIEQKHLLREELTQSLGLFNDSYKYPESIFYQDWTYTTEYAPIDIELIKMLYNE